MAAIIVQLMPLQRETGCENVECGGVGARYTESGTTEMAIASAHRYFGRLTGLVNYTGRVERRIFSKPATSFGGSRYSISPDGWRRPPRSARRLFICYRTKHCF
jgi:hypothetical protein